VIILGAAGDDAPATKAPLESAPKGMIGTSEREPGDQERDPWHDGQE
jgi:hypothetical protein